MNVAYCVMFSFIDVSYNCIKRQSERERLTEREIEKQTERESTHIGERRR